MPITGEGLKAIVKPFITNTFLDLTYNGNKLQGNNYAAVTCHYYDPNDPPSEELLKRKNHAYFELIVGNNKVTIQNKLFYFQDADNGTSNVTGDPSDVWTVDGVKLGNYYEGTFSPAITVGQFYRPKFAAGAFKIEITSTDDNSSS